MINDNAPFNPEDFGFELFPNSGGREWHKGEFRIMHFLTVELYSLRRGEDIVELGNWPSSNREFRIRNEGVVGLEIYG